MYRLSIFDEKFLRGPTYLPTLWLFLPKFYIEIILLPHTNNSIKGAPLSFGEFFWFIGLWLLITSHPGDNIIYFFLERSIDIFEGALIWLNVFMTGNRFGNIVSTFSFTDLLPPYFKEKFFENIQMIVVWDYHMAYVVIPLWLSCLCGYISI